MKNFYLFILFIPSFGTGQLKVAQIFSDNMVIQSEKPMHIWGKGVPGEKVEVLFANKKRSSVVNIDSSWSIYFNKQKTNRQPQSLLIASRNEKIALRNILIGDVWVCLGQSNMEWPVREEMHYREELSQSNQPLLRFYNPTYAGKNVYGQSFTDSIVKRLIPNDFYHGQWQASDSNSFRGMSAVGYYFGKQILHQQQVPVGLINLAIGGAPIETFISKEAMNNNERFAPKVKGNWLVNDMLPVWVRQRGKQNVGDQKNVFEDGLGPYHAFKPGFAFESGIVPILALPIKGVIWYQGESNTQEIERVNEYGELFKLMINDYRLKWNQPDLPFYFVQLSSIDTTNYKSHLWPQFRDEQRKLLSEVKNIGMAVSSDIGSKHDVHPTNKKEVGKRLARWALNKTYKKKIIPSGPLPLKAKYQKGRIIISFNYTANGLQTADSKPLKDFQQTVLQKQKQASKTIRLFLQ